MQTAIDGRTAEPLRDLGALAAAYLRGLTIDDVIRSSSSDDAGFTHPLLVDRLRSLGVAEPALRLPERSALVSLLGEEANGLAERLIEVLRPTDARLVVEALNPPRLTPGTLAWLLIGFAGLVFFAIAMIGGPVGDLPIIAAVALVLWLLYALVYPYLQREVILDAQGIRIRPWWRRWMERDAADAKWTWISWADRPALTIGIEAIVDPRDRAHQASRQCSRLDPGGSRRASDLEAHRRLTGPRRAGPFQRVRSIAG